MLERIVAETRGNPLALLELPRGLTPAQLAGGFGLPAALPLSAGIEQSFTRRLARLPRDARRLLLAGGRRPGRRSGASCGAPRSSSGSRRRPRTPSSRKACWRWTVRWCSAIRSCARRCTARPSRTSGARLTARWRTQPIRRSTRIAARGTGRRRRPCPTRSVAGELERSAARAQARGGFAAAAAFLERAADADTRTRAPRAARAGRGADEVPGRRARRRARSALVDARSGALDELDRARVDLLRAQIAFVSTHGSDAPALLLRGRPPARAARSRRSRARRISRRCRRRCSRDGWRRRAQARSTWRAAAKAAPRPPVLGGLEVLLDGLATLFSDGYEAAVPILRRAQSAFDGGDMPASEQLRWKWLAAIVVRPPLGRRALGGDLRSGTSGSPGRPARSASFRSRSSQRVYAHLFAGELTAAASLVDEIRAATEATGSNLTPYGAVGLAALRGREPEAISLIDASREDATRRGEGIGLSVLDWAQARAVQRPRPLRRGSRGGASGRSSIRTTSAPSNWGMVELIEAAVRAGTPELAADARSRLAEMARASGTDWALGIAARSEALLADGRASRGALRRGDRSARPDADRGRSRACPPPLRRVAADVERRRLDARGQLRTAHDLFSDFGMEAFAERARVELEATGEHARKRTVETLGELTPQEAQISRLAREGHTNAEIAAQLFISPSTVEYHLRKVFRKLGVKSRTQLAQVLPPEPKSALPSYKDPNCALPSAADTGRALVRIAAPVAGGNGTACGCSADG